MCTKRFGSFVSIRKQWKTSLYDKEGLTFHFSYFYNWKSLDNVEIKIADWLFLHHRSAHKQRPHPWIVWCVGSTQGHGGQKAHFSLCHYCIRTDSLWSMWLLRIKKADLLFHSRSNYSFQCLYCELAGVAVPPIDNSVLLLSGRAEMMTLESEGGKGRRSLRTTHTHARGASHTHQNTFSLNTSKCFGECETRGGQAAFHCSADETEGCTYTEQSLHRRAKQNTYRTVEWNWYSSVQIWWQYTVKYTHKWSCDPTKSAHMALV